MLRKILVPTDFSETSMAAVERARELALGTHAELIALHASELPVMPMGEIPYFSLSVYEELERGQRQRLASLVEELGKAGVRARGIFHVGMASSTILEFAQSESVDLIVLGTHGRHGLPRVLLGSVAERVVRTSPVPVLTVHGVSAQAAASH